MISFNYEIDEYFIFTFFEFIRNGSKTNGSQRIASDRGIIHTYLK